MKHEARQAMEDAGVPILPGTKGVIKSPEEGLETAEQIGFPVMMPGVGSPLFLRRCL